MGPDIRRFAQRAGGRPDRPVEVCHAAPRRASDHCLLFRLATLCSLAATVIAPAAAEPFIGQFELKTLESEPGEYEFQSQNAWSWGQPPRRIQPVEDGFELDDNAVVRRRHALELEIGLTRFLKTRVGIEFEQERLDEPASLADIDAFDSLKLAEVGAELIGILVPREGDGAGFGVVVEIEGPVDGDEPNHFVFGPIVEYQSGRWFLSAIPMLVHAFGGEADDDGRSDDKWDFAYATQLRYAFSPRWALALEAYGTVERLGNSGHRSDAARLFGDSNQHRAGPVLYYRYTFDRAGPVRTAMRPGALTYQDEEEEGTRLTIGLGWLQGLTDHTPDHTLKFSLEVQF